MNGYVHSVESFGTVDGPGLRFIVFVQGCGLRCAYCHNPDSWKMKEGKVTEVSEIVSELVKYKEFFDASGGGITVSGGEPLLQNEIYPLIYELVSLGYNVSIETNGTLPIEADNYRRSFKYVMDVKCPSSGVSDKNLYSNLANLKVNDEVKFVIKDREDYNFMKSILIKYPTKAKILVSPMFDKDLNPLIGKEVVDWLVEDKLDHIKLQLQIHKIINVL